MLKDKVPRVVCNAITLKETNPFSVLPCQPLISYQRNSGPAPP
uniref:Uncharacterized protein n=1 Tax=Anguilla anguilla TaxID=7936 RepID=A0A0E9RUP3_ANGAN